MLKQCLKCNIEFGILENISYPDLPARGEYKVTDFGQSLGVF
ncbi:hypothetical protein [Shewanella sp. KX20019]